MTAPLRSDAAAAVIRSVDRPAPSGGIYPWYVVGVLLLINALSYLDRQVMSILVSPIQADLGFTDTRIGLLLGPAFMVLFVLAGYAGMLVARSAVGMGEACVVPAAFSLVSDYFAAERRGRATSWVTIGIPIGAAAALFGGGLLLHWAETLRGAALPLVGVRSPWAIVLIVFGGLGLVVALLTLTLRDPRKGGAHHKPEPGAPRFTQ